MTAGMSFQKVVDGFMLYHLNYKVYVYWIYLIHVLNMNGTTSVYDDGFGIISMSVE